MDEISAVRRLNVGGREYVASASTLQKVEGSMLATMFTTTMRSETLNGAYFIDRDGDMFSYVLEYLRTDTVELPDSIEVLKRLQKEADFFMLPGLQTLIRSKLQRVLIELKCYSARFRCSDKQCNCGDGRPNYEAFDDSELECLEDDILHFDSDVERPAFGPAFACVNVSVEYELAANREGSAILARPISLENALRVVRRAMAQGDGLGADSLTDVCKEVGTVIEDLIELPELSHREIYMKVGKYKVGEKYDLKGQTCHYRTAVRVELNVQCSSQNKRRRIEERPYSQDAAIESCVRKMRRLQPDVATD